MLDPKYFQHCVITTSYSANFWIYAQNRKYRKYAPIVKNSDQFILFCWVTWSVSVMGGSFLAPPLPTPDTFASVALSIICLSKSFASVALFNNFATFSIFTLKITSCVFYINRLSLIRLSPVLRFFSICLHISSFLLYLIVSHLEHLIGVKCNVNGNN